MNTPLPWYIAGPLIGLIVPLLLLLREKQLGISSSYRFLGSFFLKRFDYFNYNRKSDSWQIVFAIGLVLSGVFFKFFNSNPIVQEPEEGYYYQLIHSSIYSLEYGVQFFVGGILVGFGARYANGCTAGHCIMGVSQFATSSIVATVAFFVGGLIVSLFINPFIF